MSDLIWIGNMLLPRWLVIAAVAFVVLSIVTTFVILTDEERR